MPRCVLVRYSTLVDYPVALHAALGVLFFVALDADDFLVTWYETLVSDWLQTDFAAEALFVPLLALVFVLLHAGSEESSTSVTSGGEVVVMTVGTVELVVLGGERMVDQRYLTVATLETFLVPMAVFVGQVLRVATNRRLALFARIGEQRLVTFDAEWFLVAQDVPVAGQIQVAIEARKYGRITSAFHD
jgi:hypothetical protein